MEMWKNGIFLEDFSFYSSSLEIDCIGFFAAPIYLLTKNLGLSMALCHGIGYLVIAYLLFDITKQLRGTREQFLMMLLLYFTPYSVTMLDWAQMLSLSVGQYSFRVFTMLLLLDMILLLDEQKAGKPKLVVTLIASLAVNFWTSLSSGNYVLCMIIIPFVLAYVFNAVRHHVRFRKDPVFYLLITSALVSYAGHVLRLSYAGEGHRSDLNLITTFAFTENIGKAITGLFELLGGLVSKNNISVFSGDGIGTLLRFAFWVLGFVIVFRKIRQDSLRTKWLTYIFMMILVNLGILLLTDTHYGSATFEHRYHILWCVMAIICLSMTMMDRSFWGRDTFVSSAICSCLVVAVVAMNIFGFLLVNNVDEKNGDKGFEKAMIQIAKEQGTDSILVYNWSDSPSVITVLEPEMYSAYITANGGTTHIVSFDHYLSYTDNAKMSSHVLICTESFLDQMPEHLQTAYTLADSETFGGDLYAYYAAENRFDTISGLPMAADDLSIDLPYSPGYQRKGKLDDTGCLISDTKENGFVLWGPKTPAVEGVYHITLEYEVLSSGERNAFFDISAENGQHILLRSDLPNDATSFTFENVEITGSTPLEFRVWKPGDATIAIKRIVFERVH